jgi:hypothetical protein
MACGHLSTRDLQSCNASPCHIIARRSNPQQTSTLFSWHCDDGRVHARTAATPLYPCPWADYFCQPPPPPIPPPRVEIGQGNWKIVGSLRQFAIFCGLQTSTPLSQALWPGVKRRSPVHGILLAPRQHDVAVPPCRAYARIVKGRARVVGV